MKLSLLFLIFGGLVNFSHLQQQQQRLVHSNWIPNNYVLQTRLPYYYFADQSDADYEINPRMNYESPTNDMFGRRAGSKNNNPQSRFFGALLYSLLRGSSSTITFTSTTTSFTTIVSTISSVIIQNCISSANFASGTAATTCLRRKRSIKISSFDPSQVLPMESTRIGRSYYERNSEPIVLSSLLDLVQESGNNEVIAPRNNLMRGFFQNNSNVPTTITVVTVNSTFTSYSFLNATTVKKPFNLLGTATSAITCIPPGFTFC